MKEDKHLGKTVIARFGVNRVAVKIIESVKNSRTMLLVEDVGRGQGWNKLKNKYTDISKFGSWTCGKIMNSAQEKIHANQIVENE